MPYVTFTDLRRNLASHLDRIEADRTELVVVRQNHDPVVVLSLAEREGMKETLHLLASPANTGHLRASIAELDSGVVVEKDLTDQ